MERSRRRRFWLGREDRTAEGDRERTPELLEAALAALGQGVVVFSPGGRVAHANEAGRRILGRRFDHLSEVAPGELQEALAIAAEGGGGRDLEFDTGPAHVRARVVPAGGGVVLLAEEETDATAVERLRRDFVANASHELKTPVASILALAETLAQGVDDEEAHRRFLGRLEQEAARLSRLVTDLLDLSRLEAGVSPPEPVRIDRVVADELDRLRARAESSQVRLVMDSLDEAEVTGASEADIGLMVHNLLDNAIRFTPAGGEVRVALSAGEQVEFRVDDTGIGIPAADLDRVFERFYRVDVARSRETGGTGLGLSIVRHVAEACDGTVQVQSVLGAGSTFKVLFRG